MPAGASDPGTLLAEIGVNPFACMQCGRCSSGCPTAFETDQSPRRIMRYLQWGWIDEATRSPFPWLCASCQACTTRCPRGLDIAGTMFALRRHALARGLMQADRAGHFCEAFMDLVRTRGRVSELLLGLRMARHGGIHWDDVRLALQLFWKGRLGGSWVKIARGGGGGEPHG